MFYTIYKTVNKLDGKTYIGKHITNNLYDGYLGSGKYLKRAIKKYGVDYFEKFILYTFDNKKEMDDKERGLVNEDFLKSGKSYNLKVGGEGGWEYLNNSSPEHLVRCVKGGKIANKLLQEYYRCHPEKKADRGKGLREWAKSNDPEIRRRRSEISSRRFLGKHHTKETKKMIGEKNSIHQLGENNSQYGRVWIYSLIEKKSIPIPKNDLQIWIERGWIKGRKMKFA